MQKAVFILGMYAILFAIAGIDVYFKLKKERKNEKKQDEKKAE